MTTTVGPRALATAATGSSSLPFSIGVVGCGPELVVAVVRLARGDGLVDQASVATRSRRRTVRRRAGTIATPHAAHPHAWWEGEA